MEAPRAENEAGQCKGITPHMQTVRDKFRQAPLPGAQLTRDASTSPSEVRKMAPATDNHVTWVQTATWEFKREQDAAALGLDEQINLSEKRIYDCGDTPRSTSRRSNGSHWQCRQRGRKRWKRR